MSVLKRYFSTGDPGDLLKLSVARPSKSKARRNVAIAQFAVLALALGLGGSPSRAAIPGALVVTELRTYVPGQQGDPTANLLILNAGTELHFANVDRDLHTVTSVLKVSRIPIFDTAILGTGESDPVIGTAFLAVGTYAFYCKLHPTIMKGTLVVV